MTSPLKTEINSLTRSLPVQKGNMISFFGGSYLESSREGGNGAPLIPGGLGFGSGRGGARLARALLRHLRVGVGGCQLSELAPPLDCGVAVVLALVIPSTRLGTPSAA